ncbi:MAG: DNA repair protein RecN [Armatimonadetes bacterium]|nr:DNA repair protein RecN [Armatimonadota bacterium]
MLTELHITNFALIDELRLEFGPGLTVLTGETGAGKSIIVDAMACVLGERTGSEVVRTGAEKCIVEAVFDIADNHAVATTAIECGCEPEEGLLILTREIARGGRSTCRINGRLVTASTLRQITSKLVDLHGQHEHQSLLSVPLHIETLDAWLARDSQNLGSASPQAKRQSIVDLRAQARSAYEELRAVIAERDRLESDERERARLLDLYQFQAKEIGAAGLQSGEDEELATERNRLANAERLQLAAAEIYDALGKDSAAVDTLTTAAAAAERMAEIDPSVNPIVEMVNTALYSAQEALLAIREYQERIDANPARLEEIEDRLDLIRKLKRKYGDTIEEIIEYGNQLASKIEELAHSEERSRELDSRIDGLRCKIAEICRKLSEARKTAAPDFGKAVEHELADLAMEKTRFEVSIRETEPGPTGADAVEFLISPNPGEPVKPLVKIASGGEISRIMLALKTVTRRSETPVMVFDEIDTGIGGMTAQALGEKLASLACVCQVLCVTHLPQVACRATTHLAVEKLIGDGKTSVRVKKLEGEDRVRELARMLGGGETSQAATLHAREMLETVSAVGKISN